MEPRSWHLAQALQRREAHLRLDRGAPLFVRPAHALVIAPVALAIAGRRRQKSLVQRLAENRDKVPCRLPRDVIDLDASLLVAAGRAAVVDASDLESLLQNMLGRERIQD